MTLQNHLGDAEFPVRARSRFAREIEQRRRALPGPNARRALVLVGLGLPFGALGLWIALTFWPEGTELANPFFGGLAGFIVGFVLAAILASRWDAGVPRRAQRAYLEAAGIPPVTLAQQQILALDAAGDFAFGGWNSSLAFAPGWIEMPAAMRARYEDGKKGTPWEVLRLAAPDRLRVDLDSGWKIASATDLEMVVADVLAEGRLSRQLAQAAAAPQADAMFSRIAALTGIDVFDLRELVHPADGEPPELLLAADTEWAIGAVRFAYMSGYVSADRAWELLARVAAPAFRRYADYDAYWRAVGVATAFRTDTLDAVATQRAHLAGLRERGWPSATVAFPRAGRVVRADEAREK